ncbi:MAG: hypothetical protein ACTSQP_21230 [Promethearchaeota archaeon]
MGYKNKNIRITEEFSHLEKYLLKRIKNIEDLLYKINKFYENQEGIPYKLINKTDQELILEVVEKDFKELINEKFDSLDDVFIILNNDLSKNYKIINKIRNSDKLKLTIEMKTVSKNGIPEKGKLSHAIFSGDKYQNEKILEKLLEFMELGNKKILL